MVSQVERLHVYLLSSWVEVSTGHAKKPPPLPQISEGEQINFTVPPPNQLLSPVLSTSRSGEFRNGLKSKKHICLPTQILHSNAYGPMEKKPLHYHNFQEVKKSTSRYRHQNKLLNPFLSTSQSGEFRTSLTN